MIFGTIDPVLGVVVAALVAPLLGYFGAAKKLSGEIKHSDATELWAESRSIREWSTDRVKELNEDVESLERRLTELEKANSTLAEENRKLTREVYELRNTIHDLQGNIISLTHLLEQERAHVAQLKWEAEHSPRRRYSDPTIPDKEVGGEADDHAA